MGVTGQIRESITENVTAWAKLIPNSILTCKSISVKTMDRRKEQGESYTPDLKGFEILSLYFPYYTILPLNTTKKLKMPSFKINVGSFANEKYGLTIC